MTSVVPPNIWKRFCQHLIELNVFTVEYEQSIIDNGHGQQNTTHPDPRLLQEQRISTRVYIITFIS